MTKNVQGRDRENHELKIGDEEKQQMTENEKEGETEDWNSGKTSRKSQKKGESYMNE